MEEKTLAPKQVKGRTTALILMVMDLNQESSEMLGTRRNQELVYEYKVRLSLFVWHSEYTVFELKKKKKSAFVCFFCLFTFYDTLKCKFGVYLAELKIIAF